MHNELAAMDIEVDNDENNYEEQMTRTLSDHELQKILEDDNETEEENTYITDSNIDACRINTGSIPGNIIINFNYYNDQIHKKFDNHCRGIECSFRDLTFIGGRAYGLRYKLFFKYRMCNFEDFVWTQPPTEESLDINIGAVAGGILNGAVTRKLCCYEY